MFYICVKDHTVYSRGIQVGFVLSQTCCCRPTPPACSWGPDNPISLEKPFQASLPPDQQRHHSLSRDIQRSSMLFEVYRCVQLNRWSVICGCVLHRGQRGKVWCVSSTLCRYDIRMGLLLVRSWARVRRVSMGRESSEGEIWGPC